MNFRVFEEAEKDILKCHGRYTDKLYYDDFQLSNSKQQPKIVLMSTAEWPGFNQVWHQNRRKQIINRHRKYNCHKLQN